MGGGTYITVTIPGYLRITIHYIKYTCMGTKVNGGYLLSESEYWEIQDLLQQWRNNDRKINKKNIKNNSKKM